MIHIYLKSNLIIIIMVTRYLPELLMVTDAHGLDLLGSDKLRGARVNGDPHDSLGDPAGGRPILMYLGLPLGLLHTEAKVELRTFYGPQHPQDLSDYFDRRQHWPE